MKQLMIVLTLMTSITVFAQVDKKFEGSYELVEDTGSNSCLRLITVIVDEEKTSLLKMNKDSDTSFYFQAFFHDDNGCQTDNREDSKFVTCQKISANSITKNQKSRFTDLGLIENETTAKFSEGDSTTLKYQSTTRAPKLGLKKTRINDDCKYVRVK